MARLPTPGGDENTWGNVLNDFLAASHNTDGSLKDSAVTGLAGQSVSAATPSDNDVLAYNSGSGQWEPVAPGLVSVPDATSSSKGVVQLAGDLGGTAASPTVPGLANKENTITAGTTAQYWRGDKSFQTLDKTAVGLANVDNTSDANKPVSSATQTALNAKADSSALTTHTSATTSVHGIANTANLETTSGAQAKVDAHANDTSDAHDASAISFSATGTIAGTDVQTAVAEVATDASADLATHAADVVLHASGREVDYAEVTSNQSIPANAFALTDVTGLDVTIPSGGTRPVYITARVQLTSTSTGQAIVGITQNVLGDAVAAGYAAITTANQPVSVTVEVRLDPGDSGTYKIGATVTAGTGTTVTNNAGPFIVCFVKAVEA